MTDDLKKRLKTMGAIGWNLIGFEALERINQLEAELAELKAENESLFKNLRGKHSITGATYAHIISERNQLREHVTLLRDAIHDVCCNPEVEIFLSGRKILQKVLTATEQKP